MKFNKKQIGNIIFYVLIALMLIPRTRVYFLGMLSFSPRVEKIEKRANLSSYDWQLKGVNTEDYDFNQAKGKVVLVNFWATWCMPCVAEMPGLEALYKDYGNKVDFLLVTSDTPDKVLPFMEKKQFTMPIYNQFSNNPKEFDTNTIPKTFLIDKKGNIVIESSRADWDTKKIRKLIDGLLKE